MSRSINEIEDSRYVRYTCVREEMCSSRYICDYKERFRVGELSWNDFTDFYLTFSRKPKYTSARRLCKVVKRRVLDLPF